MYFLAANTGVISVFIFFLNNIFSSPPWQHPVKTYGYAFFFSLTGYFGISFVLALIKLFGALVAVTGQSNISCCSNLSNNFVGAA